MDNSAQYCALPEEELNPLFAVNTGMLQIELFCIMTMLDHIWRQWLLKEFENWNSSSSPHTAYSPDLAPPGYHIFGPFKDTLHGCQFANDDIKDALHTWLHTHQKHSLQMTSGSLWTEVTNVWRSLGITSKNDSVFLCTFCGVKIMSCRYLLDVPHTSLFYNRNDILLITQT
jgi:hypothetical protein